MRLISACFLFLMVTAVAADDSLWRRLQYEPNMVVLMRNAESTGNRDGANMLAWDASGNCKGESVLTEKGKAHAAKIGEMFDEHNISPIVITSPMCRCRETSRIAFGNFHSDPGLLQTSSMDSARQEAFQARANALLTKYRGKRPIAFVNHRPNIDALTMELLDIGDLLVGVVSDDGDIDVLGKIRIEP